MKKEYEKPIVELVVFEANSCIATSCVGHPATLEQCLPAANEGADGAFDDVNGCLVVVYCYHTSQDININS